MTKEQFIAILVGEFDYHPKFADQLWEDSPNDTGIGKRSALFTELGMLEEQILASTRKTAKENKHLDDMFRFVHQKLEELNQKEGVTNEAN